MQIRMLEGRYQAVKALRDTAIDAVQDSDVKAFISSKGEALINDILGSKHVWSEGAQSNCAMTDLSLLSPIRLSMPTCRDDVKFTADAAKLLIHESVHHLGIEDEDFANRVALNAYELHKSKIPPTLSVECNLTYKLTADGAETRLKFLEPLQPNKEFIALRREVQVSGEAYQFYVYYDGHYSA
ncbi:MAG: hypothetical protein NTV34_00630 [Proteobacteria bacterium]|nr:hypothetical protein [Pseudomonadota bacterium]